MVYCKVNVWLIKVSPMDVIVAVVFPIYYYVGRDGAFDVLTRSKNGTAV